MTAAGRAGARTIVFAAGDPFRPAASSGEHSPASGIAVTAAALKR